MSLAAPARQELPARAALQRARPPPLQLQRHPEFDENDKIPGAAGRCACGGGCPRCQASMAPGLSVTLPGDRYEGEADRIADAVARSALHPAAAVIAPVSAVPSIMPLAAQEAAIPLYDDSVAARLDAGAGRGDALPRATRERMESGIGASFGGVRVHADAGADALSRELGARAFTHGSDIYFRSGEYRPGTREGDWLLAHELTHVVQQGAAAPERVQRLVQRQDDGSIASVFRQARASVGRGVRSARETVREAAGAVRETAAGVVQSAQDLITGLLERHAPGVLALIRGDVVGEFKRRIYAGMDYLFNGLGSRIRTEGLTATMRAVFADFVEGIGTIASDLSNGRCESLFAAVRTLRDFGERLSSPAFRELRELASEIATAFNELWEKFGAPVAEAVSTFAGGLWDEITAQAQQLWNDTAEIRQWFADAWQEYKRRFGIVWNGAGDLLAELRAKAERAWNEIKQELGPWLLPLQLAAGALLLISPLGPFIIGPLAVYALWRGIGWIVDHWDEIEEVVVTARQYLHDEVLPKIMEGVETVREKLAQAGQAIEEAGAQVTAAFNALVEALGLSPFMAALRRIVSAIATEVVGAVRVLMTEVRHVFAEIRRIAGEIHTALRPFYGLIVAVVLFPQYPFLLPIVLAGWAWRLAPDCIKPPIIDFALDVMIGAVRAIPDFRSFGDTWADAKALIVRQLVSVRDQGFEAKIDTTNRIARIMTGEDIDWIGNLAVGARDAPAHFNEQLREEIGASIVDHPLPFERTGEPAPVAPTLRAEREEFASTVRAVVGDRPLTEQDIGVEPAPEVELEPELEEELVAGERRDGDVIDLASGGAEAEPARGEERGEPAAAAATEQRPEEPRFERSGDPTEDRLRRMLAEPVRYNCDQRPEEGPAQQSAVPEEAKWGPLTRWQRTRFLFDRVGRGVQQWFYCNKHWLVPTLILGVIALIVTIALTGGAVIGAIGEIMQILAPIFFGLAALRVAVFIGQYVRHAIAGDTENAAKALARALAAAAIEIIFALLFNLRAVIRQSMRAVSEVAQGGIAAARRLTREAIGGARAAVRETLGEAARAARSLRGRVQRGLVVAGEGIGRFGNAIVRGGRVFLRGVEQGFARGVRTVRDLIQRIRNWFRQLHGIRVRIAGMRLIFEIEVNPWITIFEARIRVHRGRQRGAIFVTPDELTRLRQAERQGAGRLREFETVLYRESTSAGRGIVGDRLTGDHIPSRAALVQRWIDDWRASHGGREPSEAIVSGIERRARDEGVTVVLRSTTHETLSRTYAGRNTARQIVEDASDLGGAFGRDARAILEGLENERRLTPEIAGAYLRAYSRNVERGVFRHNRELDRILQEFVTTSRRAR